MEHALMANTRYEIASYRLRDEIVITDLPKGNLLLEVWIPVPQTDANQQVLEVSVESDADLSLHYDREWGNAIFYARLPSVKGFRAECFTCGSTGSGPPPDGSRHDRLRRTPGIRNCRRAG